METYNGYEPVKILDVYAKIYSQQVYYHKGRDEYNIERMKFADVNARYLSPLFEIEQEVLNELLVFEKCVRDAQGRQDDEGKEAGR